jgi:hypothetical protein
MELHHRAFGAGPHALQPVDVDCLARGMPSALSIGLPSARRRQSLGGAAAVVTSATAPEYGRTTTIPGEGKLDGFVNQRWVAGEEKPAIGFGSWPPSMSQ